MSDDDRDIDVESDAEKRAHHNASERKRRDHIKDSFTSLRDSIPALNGEKASRAQILNKAAEYIQFIGRKSNAHRQDIDDLKRQNHLLEAQIRTLEKEKSTGTFSLDVTSNRTESDTSDNESAVQQRRSKKIKFSGNCH